MIASCSASCAFEPRPVAVAAEGVLPAYRGRRSRPLMDLVAVPEEEGKGSKRVRCVKKQNELGRL